MNSTPKKLFIIDAMAMAFRNYHAFGQRPLMTSTGIHTSAVFGSALFMLKLIEDEKPDLVICATDSKEKTFRHDMYPAYKANRSEMPADLADQLPYFFELFTSMGIPVLKHPGMEADDLIGSICEKFASDKTHCFIVSGDKDFMQLISPSVYIYAPKKNEPALLVSYPQVAEKFGCKPEQVIDVLALIGDTSDNVPGVHGIGDKGAAKLIGEYHTLEGIYEHLDEIKNAKLKNALTVDRESAFLSRQLVTIKKDIPLDVTLDEMAVNRDALANEKLLDLFTRMEFRGLTTKIKDRLTSGPALASAANDAPGMASAQIIDPLGQAIAKENPGHSAVNTSKSKLGNDYILANTPELVMRLAQELKDADVFSFDTETTGLDRVQDTPIGISVSTRDGHAWYVPLVKKHLTGWLTPEFVKEQLASAFTDGTKTKIAHNLKFDLQMFRNAGIKIRGPFGDTMLASYVLNPLAREHGLDYCAMESLQFKKIPTTALMGPKYQTPMIDVPIDDLAAYACEDADVVFQLHERYLGHLAAAGLMNVYSNIEVPLAPILSRMEQAGVHVDADALGEISIKLDRRAKELEQAIYKEAGEEFNINSPKQLQVILFEKLAIHTKLGLTRLKKTKSGFSTDVSVLEAMSEHPLANLILEFRTVTKLKNTYVDALPQMINPKSGRIHTSFHQTGTSTGRLSSSDPNLQNIPIRKEEGREIRKAFTASAPDRIMVSADYSQVELRLLAHIADDEGLKAAFASGQDIHTATASRIFGVPLDKVTQELRSNAKAINFGIIYGMGPQRLARDTGVSMAEAKTFIDKYFDGFPRIRAYIESSKTKARETGYSVTMTGRRRPIPEIHSKDRGVMINGENMAVNSPIQGSAADLIKLAMIETQKRLDASGLDAVMLLQVHDELVFECHESTKDAVMALIKDAMEHAMTITVPLKVEIGAGKNWLEAH
ncbi:MAG: DNA polymerase I [Pseudomonadota bacterium]